MKNFRILLVLIFFINPAFAQKPPAQPFVIENYYKAKWGYAEEFLDLYKANHYPLLKKAIEKGDILSIKLEMPRQHGPEEARWDFRVTLVFKDVEAAFDPNLTKPYEKTLYPDLDKLKKEEKRRFEILDAHWDVEVQSVDLEK